MNKKLRQVSLSIWFEEDDFSYDINEDYSSALEKPIFPREKLHQTLDKFLDEIIERRS